jgi:hypothetical protein
LDTSFQAHSETKDYTPRPPKRLLPSLLDRVQPSETTMLLGTAIVVGMGTGLGAVLFIALIELIQRAFFAKDMPFPA